MEKHARQIEFDWLREDRENDLMRMPAEKLDRIMEESRRRHEREVAQWRVRDIALVSCSKTKAPVRQRARDLYRGRLFKLAAEYAEVQFGEWYILSAKHNLVDPDAELEPYEFSMRQHRGREARERWALITANDIGMRVKPGKGSRFVFLAGYDYHGILSMILEERGYEVETPLRGGYACQASWIAGRLEELKLL